MENPYCSCKLRRQVVAALAAKRAAEEAAGWAEAEEAEAEAGAAADAVAAAAEAYAPAAAR